METIAQNNSQIVRRPCKSVSPPGTVLKKCRICFQAERVATSSADHNDLQRGKTREGRQSSWTYRVQRFLNPLMEDIESEKEKKKDEDGFISPCKCSGSMAWVHRSCLKIWRNRSPRRDSFYKCEQCFTPYKFRQTQFSRILSGSLVTFLLTIVVLILMFVGTTFLATVFVPPIFEDEADFTGYSMSTLVTMTGDSVTIHHTTQPIYHPKYQGYNDNDEYIFSITTTNSTDNNNGQSVPTETSKRTSTHSSISYLNLGYLLSGHSIDDVEEAENDFLSAMMDLSQRRLYGASLILLAIFSFLRDCSQSDVLQAMFLLLCLVFWCILGLEWVLWLVPLPTAIGIVKVAFAAREFVDQLVDVIVKQSSSELEDYTPDDDDSEDKKSN